MRFLPRLFLALVLLPALAWAAEPHVVLHDRASGTTVPVGPPGGRDPALSADGRTIALVTDSGLHLVDCEAGTARQVVAGSIETPVLSRDGTVVAFVARDLEQVPGDANGRKDVLVLETASGRLSRISRHGGSNPALSGDGRFVTYDVWVSTAGPSLLRAVLHDRRTGRNTPIGPTSADSESYGARLSDDGRFVAYGAGRLLVDRIQTVPVARPRVVAGALSGPDYQHFRGGLDLSADGGFVAFASEAAGLAPVRQSGRGHTEVYRWERASGRIRLVSDGQGNSWAPATSAQGRWIAWLCGQRVLLKDLSSGRVSVLGEAAGPPDLSGDGRFVVFPRR